ncbi:hypothetical protein CYMTET_28987 [Cymbomonas tetramitiformis]|uniref:Peptidase S8/S53 domain-containing protein n=1 Tax=Cymbomonas tetramitiformis TaxID=36881 RepID=A0AAE0KVD0_9CHLO|nr:hypothetical protein CYMTET_28987 [Cymbomonas tetramitiformis]
MVSSRVHNPPLGHLDLAENTYRCESGTSMAAAHVAGAAALLLAVEPELAAAELKRLLLMCVDPLIQARGICVSGGRLNVGSAVRGLQDANGIVSNPQAWAKIESTPHPPSNRVPSLAVSPAIESHSAVTGVPSRPTAWKSLSGGDTQPRLLRQDSRSLATSIRVAPSIRPTSGPAETPQFSVARNEADKRSYGRALQSTNFPTTTPTAAPTSVAPTSAPIFSDDDTIIISDDADILQNLFALYAADIDGDGHVDALSGGNRSVYWFKRDCAGSYVAHPVVHKDDGDAIVGSLYAGDLDEDGDNDVLVSYQGNTGSDRVVWYRNDGTGHFDLGQVVADGGYNPVAVYAFDADQDGDLDVLVAQNYHNADANVDPAPLDYNVALFKNGGNGTFNSSQRVVISQSRPGSCTLDVADFDEDGFVDVLTGSTNTGPDSSGQYLEWWDNDGTGTTFGNNTNINKMCQNTSTSQWDVPCDDYTYDYSFSAVAADLNGDGHTDVLVAQSEDISWFANDGSGNFGDARFVGARYPRTVLAQDIDRDGDLDVVVQSLNGVAYFLNDGSGSFSEMLPEGSKTTSKEIDDADLHTDRDAHN